MNETLLTRDRYVDIINQLIKAKSPKASLEKLEIQYLKILKEFYQGLIVEIESINNGESKDTKHYKLKYLGALARNRLDFLKYFFPIIDTKNDLRQVQKKLAEYSDQLNKLIEKHLHLVKIHSLFTSETLPFDEGKSHVIERQIISEYIQLTLYEADAPEATRMNIEEKINEYKNRRLYYEKMLLKGQIPIGKEFEKVITIDEDGNRKSELRKRENPSEFKAKYGIFIHLVKSEFLEFFINNFSISVKKEKAYSLRLALRYFYLRTTGYETPFDLGMEDGYKSISNENQISYQNFKQNCSKVSSNAFRRAEKNTNHLKAVIEKLADYPKAIQMAQDELAIALSKK